MRGFSWKAFVKRRFASREAILYTFVAAVFVIHVWAIYNVLRVVPAWMVRMSSWELVGTVAYTQVFALLESLIIAGLLVLAAAVLPGNLYRDKFLAVSVVVLFVFSVWAILAHYNDDVIQSGGLKLLIPVAVVFLATLLAPYVLVQRSQKFEGMISAIVQRVSVLSFIYLFIDLFSVLVIVARNI